MPISATMTPSKKCSDRSSMSNHRGLSHVITLTSWKFEMYYFLGRAQIVCRNPWKKILIKFTCKLVPTGLEQGKSIRSLDPVEVIGIQECHWWCLKRCDAEMSQIVILQMYGRHLSSCPTIQHVFLSFGATVTSCPAHRQQWHQWPYPIQRREENQWHFPSCWYLTGTPRSEIEKLISLSWKNSQIIMTQQHEVYKENKLSHHKKRSWNSISQPISCCLTIWTLHKRKFLPLKNKFHFGVPRIPSFCAVPVAFAKQDVCEIPNDPTKHPPNVTLAPNSHDGFVKWVTTLGTWTALMILGCFPCALVALVLASHLTRLDVLTSWVAWELQPIQEKIRVAFNWVSSACRKSKVTSCLRFNTAFSSNNLFFELSKNIPSPKSSKII